MTVTTTNPFPGEPIREWEQLGFAELTEATAQARAAFGDWRSVPLTERVKRVQGALSYFEANREAIAADITAQMGRPLAQARGEIDGLLERFNYLCDIAPEVLAALELPAPETEFALTKTVDEIFVVNRPRLGSMGFDLFVPVDAMEDLKLRLAKHAPLCGEAAFEKARVLATIPRFGKDFTPDNLAPEGGIEARAISYAKGCYIGQEIIARIRTYGRVNRTLVGYRPDADLAPGTQLTDDSGKTVGTLTSVIDSPRFGPIALGLAKRGSETPGQVLTAREPAQGQATVAEIPFR